jgi:hypothetical protein
MRALLTADVAYFEVNALPPMRCARGVPYRLVSFEATAATLVETLKRVVTPFSRLPCPASAPRCDMIPAEPAERAVRRPFPALSTVLASLLDASPVVRAHEWYPLACCSGDDCGPADTVVRRDDGSYLVTARGLSVVIPATFRHWQPSPDGQVHVCIRQVVFGGVTLICAFRGPGV